MLLVRWHLCTTLLVWFHPLEWGCAESWLGLGGEVALPVVCGVLRSTTVFAQPQIQGNKQATVLTWCVSGDQRSMLLWQKDLSCSLGDWTPGFMDILGVFLPGCCLLSLFYTLNLLWNFAHVSVGISVCCLLLMAHWRCFKAWWLVSTSLSIWVKIQKESQDSEVAQARQRGCRSLHFLIICVLHCHDFAFCTFAMDLHHSMW